MKVVMRIFSVKVVTEIQTEICQERKQLQHVRVKVVKIEMKKCKLKQSCRQKVKVVDGFAGEDVTVTTAAAVYTCPQGLVLGVLRRHGGQDGKTGDEETAGSTTSKAAAELRDS